MTEADPPVGRLRALATDHIRSGRWAELIALEPALRADTEYWSSWSVAACAIGRWHEGRADARDLLEECIAAGFHDMEPFGRLFEDSFGTEPDWPAGGPVAAPAGWRAGHGGDAAWMGDRPVAAQRGQP